jgi:hypothetical protein
MLKKAICTLKCADSSVFEKTFYRSPSLRDKAQALGWELFGYAPDGSIRVALEGDPQPSFTRTTEEILEKFEEQFKVVPATERRGSDVVKIVPRSEHKTVMGQRQDAKSQREEVLYGFARMLFAQAYASYADEMHYLHGFRGDWYYDLEDLTGKDDPIPPDAYETAEKALAEIEKRNGIDFETFEPPNDDPYEHIDEHIDSSELLGAALALHWVGANSDKQGAYKLKVPYGEYNWMPDNDEEWYPDEPEYHNWDDVDHG